VGGTITSGAEPVDPADCPEETGAAGVGRGIRGVTEPPVGPTTGASSDGSSPPAAELGEAVGCVESSATVLEGATLELATDDDDDEAGIMTPGSRPVGPRMGLSKLPAALEDCTGAG
jgi:hypothetical protein